MIKTEVTRTLDATAGRSRAVLRPIEAGSSSTCASCGQPLKFAAKAQLRQVIANVYQEGVWKRVEHFHPDCYEVSDSPYGQVIG